MSIINYIFDFLQLEAFWKAVTDIFKPENVFAVIDQISNANPLAIILTTLIPAILVFIIIYSNKKHQQPWYLITLACLSGLLTVSLAYILNSYAGSVLGWARLDYTANRIYLNFDAMYGVGLVEESIKMFILFLFIKKNKHSFAPYTGVMYGALIGLSFAMTENLLGDYIGNILRCFTSVPLHMCVGIIMGYFMTKSDLEKDASNKRKHDYMALFIPALIHGTYNGVVINISAVSLLYPAYTLIANLGFIAIVIGIYTFIFKLLFKMYDLNEIFYNNGEYPKEYDWYKYQDIFKKEEPISNFENRHFIE